jgi:pre-mRNA-splicing factor 38B
MAQKLEITGNQNTMNLENILLTNIQASPYFKHLFRIKTFHEVVDEISSKVNSLEPWLNNAARIPSTAFCLLYKLFTLKLTVKQMQSLLNHKNSPYIRAIGFLYLRYTCPPKQLWDWFVNYLHDEEEISLKGEKSKPITISKFLRDILLEQRYFETLFPRIPVPVMKEIQEKLRNLDDSFKKNEENIDEKKVIESDRERSRSKEIYRDRSKSRERYRGRSKSREKYRDRSKSKERYKDRSREKYRNRSKSKERYRDRNREKYRDRSKSREKYRDRSKSKERYRDRNSRKIKKLG